MNRERIAWLVSVVLIALLAFQLPGTLAQREDDYAFVRTLVDIHRQVVNNYVDPVDEDKLHQGAIDGMMEQLDPFRDRKSTRLNSSHPSISYAVFCLKKKKFNTL